MAVEQVAGATRVVLLARPGPACDRLREALQQAGADLVLVTDPTVGAEEQVLAAEPQALLIALEPSVEDALDRFEAVLVNPQVTVIFDEAELAAQRTGWDAARWVRHLAAKLNRHHDVLPPGGETDAEWHPSPGRIEQPYVDPPELDIAPFTGEAQQIADDLPSDSGLYVQPLSLTDDPDFDDVDGSTTPGFGDIGGYDGTSVAASIEDATIGSGIDDTALDAIDLDSIGLDSALESVDLDEVALDEAALEIGDLDGTGLEVETPEPAAARGKKTAFVRDLEELDRRVSSIELADVDSYGHGRKPQRGAVLIEAGLGGPDAVRQLLGELPKGFPQPVLVRLRLDGGRYDRLVKQMERATKLKVSLAKSGQPVEAGHVYFMAPELGIVEDKAKLSFSDAVGPSSLFATLPASESAVLFLSGSDPALVEVVMSQAWTGALVAGQGPEGCYDAMASTEVIARGGASGSPTELAGRLAERWPS